MALAALPECFSLAIQPSSPKWHEGNQPTFGSCINLWRGRLALTCLAQVQLASIQASSPEERRPLRSFVPRCRTWFCGNFVPKIVHNALWTPGSRKRLVFFFFATDDYSLLCKSGSLTVGVKTNFSSPIQNHWLRTSQLVADEGAVRSGPNRPR